MHAGSLSNPNGLPGWDRISGYFYPDSTIAGFSHTHLSGTGAGDFNYHERYPKDFAFYTPDKAEGIRASYKKQLRNSYDNSIHYTDYVLGEIADMMKKTDP